MSSSLELYKFVKRLPARDRSFYLLMRAYEIHAATVIDSSYDGAPEAIDFLSGLFEDEILQLTATVKPPVYIERARDEPAEISVLSIHPPIVPDPTDPFAAKLGNWASSFSNSDLSSEDEE